MTFQKGHKLNIGNKFAKGTKWTEERRKKFSERMKGNTYGFKKGESSPRKGKKSTTPAWNKGMEMPEKRGENHPNWIKDRSKIKLQHRKDNPLYKQWRREVWERDEFTCKIQNSDCKGRIEAHHILRWNDYPELRYEVNNGITLCNFHHPRKKHVELELAPQFFSMIDSDISHLI